MNLDLLKKLVETPGVSGFESKIREVIKEEVKKRDPDKVHEDTLGNLIVVKKGKREGTILFMAHMDELGMVVSSIDEKGFVGFQKLGGIDDRVLVSRVVRLITEDKEIYGVIGIVPPHLSVDKEMEGKITPWYKLQIDIGAKSKEEVISLGIDQGTPIVFKKDFLLLNNDLVVSRGLDDRFGCFILINLLEMFRKTKPLNTLVFVFTTEEEIGLRGASVVAPQLNPLLTVVVDSISASDFSLVSLPYKNSIVVGKGPVIRKVDRRMVVDEKLFNFFSKFMEEKNIEFQIGVTGGSTDASIVETEGVGFYSIPLCFPLRYTHSTVEVVSLENGEKLTRVLYELATNQIDI